MMRRDQCSTSASLLALSQQHGRAALERDDPLSVGRARIRTVREHAGVQPPGARCSHKLVLILSPDQCRSGAAKLSIWVSGRPNMRPVSFRRITGTKRSGDVGTTSPSPAFSHLVVG